MTDATTAAAAAKPETRPANPRFSPGPTTKFPGWNISLLEGAAVGRSHRSKEGKARIEEVITRSKAMLGMPADWRLAIIAGSDTGAVECALWNLFGARPAEILVWENFGNDWATDAVKELKIDAKVTKAAYGDLPDLSKVDFTRDVCFTWNGTTSGVRAPHGDWIPDNREGLVLADATSAAFAMDLPWNKLDVVTWSWQKVLGGEAQHGMMAFGPRVLERVKTYTPAWPIPKIYRIRKGDGLNEGVFKGETLNTVSLLAVEDQLVALDWAESVGGLKGLISRANANFNAFDRWIKQSNWAEWMAKDPATRSPTSLCFQIKDPVFLNLPDEEARWEFVKKMTKILEKENAALDIGGYRSAPASLRVWGGGTVETADIEALTPWLDYAFAQAKAETLAA
ncbi:phosphoserine transaminase [Neomegalonema perideroedes]|uniref:phosphoserine transaminase n=1 Tax=Neomegalonema perideroedes TaxID=217219 RepID=UPI000376C396|nr:phosphoserine transaminase [Neomegalonema perideroedes]